EQSTNGLRTSRDKQDSKKPLHHTASAILMSHISSSTDTPNTSSKNKSGTATHRQLRSIHQSATTIRTESSEKPTLKRSASTTQRYRNDRRTPHRLEPPAQNGRERTVQDNGTTRLAQRTRHPTLTQTGLPPRHRHTATIEHGTARSAVRSTRLYTQRPHHSPQHFDSARSQRGRAHANEHEPKKAD